MKKHVWLIFLSITIWCSHGSSAAIDEAGIKRDLSEGKLEKLENISDADAEKALEIVLDFLSEHESSRGARLATLRRIPNIAHWIGLDIQKRVSRGKLDFTVQRNFELLGRLKTPEAAREIGRFINSKVILESPSDDLASTDVSVQAAVSLALIGFKNAPTPNEGYTGGLGSSELEAWQAWWKDNQGRIDELVKEANQTLPGRLK